VHPDDLPQVHKHFDDCLKQHGVPIPLETRAIHKDGSCRNLEAVLQSNLDSEAVAAIVINFRDVTGRHMAEERLRESEERYRALIDNSLGLVCTHDLEGTLLSVNPHSAQSLGYEPTDMVGKKLANFLAPSVRPEFQEYLERIKQTGRDSGHIRMVSRDGRLQIWMYRNILYRGTRGDP
jgi:PAS domain S-box-containing protein